MEPAIRGLVLDSSVMVAAERALLTTPEVLRNIRASADVGDVPIVISAMTVAELAHGIYRANSPERRQRRRQFVDELKTHIPIHPVTEATARLQPNSGSESRPGDEGVKERLRRSSRTPGAPGFGGRAICVRRRDNGNGYELQL
jgi:hypothetical protein